MKRTILYLLLFTVGSSSCQQYEIYKIKKTPSKIQLTPEEYISIAYENPRTLDEKEVFELIRNFHSKQYPTKSGNITLSTNKIYVLGKDNYPQTRTQPFKQQIPMYDVTVNDGENNGSAIVAADERVAGVIAYIPHVAKNKRKAETQRENNLMLEFTELNLIGHLAFIDSIRTSSMRENTILKITKQLGIPEEEYSFEDLKEQIEIIEPKSKAYNGISGRINLEVDWGQDEPYSRFLPTYPDPIFQDLVTRHYPLGCAVTALMMVYSYFEPHMSGYDEGKPMTINWTYLKENRQIIESNYGPSDPEDKLRMIGRLGLWIYNGTKTTSSKESDGYYHSATPDSEIISDLDVYGIAHDPRTIIDPQRNSLLQRFYYDAKNYPLILMGGTRSTEEGGGNHVWVIDGFTTDKMVHANMGWNGEENGWFKISNTLHFETAIGDYSTNFWTISKLRKK